MADGLPPARHRHEPGASTYRWVRVQRIPRRGRVYWYWRVPRPMGGTTYHPYTADGLQAAIAAAEEYDAWRLAAPSSSPAARARSAPPS